MLKFFLPLFAFFIFCGWEGPAVSRAQENSLYPSLNAGGNAPPVKGRNVEGKIFRLSKVKAKYTLLYFYELHCHLCAVVTPELKKLYASYHKIGLEVVAIPVESDRNEWKKYVQEQALDWINVFPDPVRLEKLRADYKLTVSPTMYLMDREGVLITPRLGRIEQLEEELNRLLR